MSIKNSTPSADVCQTDGNIFDLFGAGEETTPSVPQRRHWGLNRDPAFIEKVRELYCVQKLTPKETAAVLGVSASSVLNLCKKLGIEIRHHESIAGTTHGRWSVLSEEHSGKRGVKTLCLCRCACGVEKRIPKDNLVLGLSKSCGCLRKELLSLDFGEAMQRSLIRSYKLGATKRGFTWELTDDEARTLFKQNCHYCGTPPTLVREKGRCNGGYVFNGIDRVRSSESYSTANVVSACAICNRAKNNYDLEMFLGHVAQIKNTPTPYQHWAPPKNTWHPSAIYPYCSTRHHAPERGLEFTIPMPEAVGIFMSPCVYCGQSGVGSTHGWRHNGIDRVSSEGFYELANAVPCCKFCNWMKMEMSVDEFLAWAARVQTHQTFLRQNPTE